MSSFEGLRTLWISWYPHRRTSGICEACGIPLIVLHSRRKGLVKWVTLALRTLWLIKRERPQLLFVQNPSLGLALVAVAVKGVSGFSVVVDAHNEGVRPFVRSGWLIQTLTYWLLRNATSTVVTNDELAQDVRDCGGWPAVLPDPLPKPPEGLPATTSPERDLVVVISTFAPDEPTEEIFIAAAELDDIDFAITGKPERFLASGVNVPDNVTLTGFLPEEQYWALLAQASVICDLTYMDDCLVCGAYEALAMKKPMVLSDNPANRRLFHDYSVLTTTDAYSIKTALKSAIDQKEQIQKEVSKGIVAYQGFWVKSALEVAETIKKKMDSDVA